MRVLIPTLPSEFRLINSLRSLGVVCELRELLIQADRRINIAAADLCVFGTSDYWLCSAYGVIGCLEFAFMGDEIL